MEPNPHVTPTLRYAAVVPPNGHGAGEKRLVFAALIWSRVRFIKMI